jgi:hypothetical protein
MCDEMISEKFNGDPERYDFSPYEWEKVLETGKPVLIRTFTDYSR